MVCPSFFGTQQQLLRLSSPVIIVTRSSKQFLDCLSQIPLVAFGEVAERLVECTALDFLTLEKKGEPMDIAGITSRLQEGKYEIQIRKKPAHQADQYFYNLIEFNLLPPKKTAPATSLSEGTSMLLPPTSPASVNKKAAGNSASPSVEPKRKGTQPAKQTCSLLQRLNAPASRNATLSTAATTPEFTSESDVPTLSDSPKGAKTVIDCNFKTPTK